MKVIREFSVVLVTILIVSCATNPQQTAVDRLSDNRKQMNDARGQVDRTMYSLDSLMRAPAAEIKNAQTQYAGNVKALRKTADQLEANAKEMRERKIDYLTEWERTQLNVESPELKRAGEQRRQQVTQSLSGLEPAIQNANQGLGQLLADLEDIERVTGNDPTPAGLAAVKKSGIVQAAQKHAGSANYRLDLAASQFDRTMAALSPQPGTQPVGTAAAPAAAGAAGAAGSAAAAMPAFSQADRNKSGAIEQDEASGIAGLDFQAADRDKDGKLSQSEYEAVKKARESGGGSNQSTR
ncbi:MAG: DUF2959 family protein [Sulfurifustis sp.]